MNCKRLFISLTALFLVTGRSAWADKPADDGPRVQLALLLDTSNSMDGLIEQAKSQLWKIVNEIAYAKRDGKAPVIEVALYQYGNNGLSAGELYVQQVLPFTRNLDEVSEKLFALRTNGGEEYCGAVIRDAMNGLQWSRDSRAYKAIFIAGNEPFTQGPVPYQEAIANATRHGVIVNTIFCGNYAEGVQTAWDSGARAGQGRFLNIDADQKIVAIPTPFDARLQELSSQLNDTYVPYGERGEQALKQSNLAERRMIALADTGAPAERARYKSSPAAEMSVRSWDAVAQVEESGVRVDSLKKGDLPADLQNKSDRELKAHFEAQYAKRQSIQKEINELHAKRTRFIADEQVKRATSGTQTLDQALQSTIREQSARRGFRF